MAIISLIKEKFGLNIYQKSFNFPSNKINLIYLREDPIKIRSIILDNEREYHLIIDEEKKEIFHDCPSFLLHSKDEDRVCVHLIKLLLIIKEQISEKILRSLKDYKLPLDDFGLKKKRKNFLLLANNCLENNNYVEALSYLNKVFINQFENDDIIEKYLKIAVEHNLYIEFFEFLQYGYENDYKKAFIKFDNYIRVGFKKFFNSISAYSFFNLLKIIESIDTILEYRKILYEEPFIDKLKAFVSRSEFNLRYFSIYFIKKNLANFTLQDSSFTNLISENQLNSLKRDLLAYFFSEIDNFCVIEKLKLLKKQFKVINIPETTFYDKYKRYKEEIKALERKVYLKKFSYLKLLIEKHNIKKSYGEFRKRRNAYIVKHDDDNLKKPVYYYIISRIGFSEVDEQNIKPYEIGINYFIIKELFLDDLDNLTDVNYYKEQFWGEHEDYELNSINAFSLLTRNVDYSYDIEQNFTDDVMLIEWDLANKPIQGTIVNAYSSQIIIPDQNSPLYHDLKPFDLCYCKKTPTKIESNIIKTINVITKCSFKDAIKSVSKGIKFIERYYPLSLIKQVVNKEISPFQAIDFINNDPNKDFVPNYIQFINVFKEFLIIFIYKEKDYIFEELKNNYNVSSNQILTLLNLTAELEGLDLPYSDILKELLNKSISFEEFRAEFLNHIHNIIKNVLDKKEIGSTVIFKLKKLLNTPFFKYSNEIIQIRKQEFESSKILKVSYGKDIAYDILDISKTYYGKKILKILNIQGENIIKSEKFNKFKDYCKKLQLFLNIVNETEE